jgi:hypothetical protein
MSESWSGGKGDRQRPFNKAKFDFNYNRIFKGKIKYGNSSNRKSQNIKAFRTSESKEYSEGTIEGSGERG